MNPLRPPDAQPAPVAAVAGTWVRRARNALARSGFELAWFLPALLVLGAGRAAVLVVPFRRLAPLLGTHTGAAAWVPLLSPAQGYDAERIGRTVRLAARYAPWTANCFPQALAAAVMLRLYRIPYTLHFGLRREPQGSGMEAHAWISAGMVNVTGGKSYGLYHVAGSFHHLGGG